MTTCEKCNGTGQRPDQTFIEECTTRPGENTCTRSNERVRKNGTCAYHACYYCDGAGTLSPRQAFMQAENKLIDAALDDENPTTWFDVLDYVRNNAATVSRAARWQSAVAWHGSENHGNDERTARWIVTQGQVYLSHGL